MAPAASEWLIERLGRALQVSPDDPGNPLWRDALFVPRPAGVIDGTQTLVVRRRSYLLEAQKHPKSVALLALLATAVVLTVVRKKKPR